MRILIVLVFISLFTGRRHKSKTQTIEIDASKDTNLFIERRSHAYSARLIVNGHINRDAQITFEQTVPNTAKKYLS